MSCRKGSQRFLSLEGSELTAVNFRDIFTLKRKKKESGRCTLISECYHLTYDRLGKFTPAQGAGGLLVLDVR